MHRPRPSIEIWMPAACKRPVKAPLVNWLHPTEAAYARSDLFARRRRLMDDLAAYLDGQRGSDDPLGG